MTAATAHRGDSSRHRENTLAAIRSAADAGARTVEVDVHVTRDGQVVLVHDDTLERLWGVDARVAGLDLADVRALGGGDLRIPLLADALELLAGTDVELVIDLASGDPAAAAHAVVQAAPRTPRVAWCGHLDGMRLIRELDPAAVIWLPCADPSRPPRTTSRSSGPPSSTCRTSSSAARSWTPFTRSARGWLRGPWTSPPRWSGWRR